MQEPYCVAMVLCDHVHRDRATGKNTILGTFGTINSASYPTTLNLSIYFAVTDGLGKHTLIIQMVNANDVVSGGDPVFRAECPVEIPDPLAVMETALALVGVKIPSAGVYHCELLCGENVLMSRRLIAHDISDQLHEGNQNDQD